MLTINDYQLPQHISYSSLSTYVDCGYKYFLTRMVNVDESPAWWSIGGNAVHTATEVYDRSPDTNSEASKLFSDAFKLHKETAKKFSDVPESEWGVAGRATKEWPDKEGERWWLAKGPDMVNNWIQWRSNSNWKLWSPDGESSAVELGIEFTHEAFDMKMFIDRVFVNENGELIVLDIKSGSRTPTSDLQLAIYAAGIEKQYGIRPQYGCYWMARGGTTTSLVNLDYLPTDKVLGMVSQFDFVRKEKIFLPNLSNCHYCNVASSCEWSKK